MEQTSLFGTRAVSNGHRVVSFSPDFAGWQAAARAEWQAGTPPADIWWQADRETSDAIEPAGRGGPSVPRSFISLARAAACYRSDDRWALLYRLLWRLTHGERHLLALAGDPDVARVSGYAKAVRRDVHKMKAFVRFRTVTEAGFDTPRYVAWFEPTHEIVAYAAGFFQRRFTNMRWSILTPDRCVHWDGAGRLRFSPGADRRAAPASDAAEDAWRVYYRSIFNPARVKTRAMMSEMPAKYWKNLPEAELIPGLIAEAGRRVASMQATVRERDDPRCGATPERPESTLVRQADKAPAGSLEQLALRAASCRRCGLCAAATQTVFGEGPGDARIMLVGEQPGDAEDLAGRPFVGPAGRLLDAALAEAGLDRCALYLTNVVKHFKFVPRGKTRLHAKSDYNEVRACRGWLDAEIDRVAPEIVIALGATAAGALLERRVAVSRDRGIRIDWQGRRLVPTVHPAFILRSRDRRAAEYQRFVADLISATAA